MIPSRPLRVVSAAVRTDDGVIHSMPPPHRHHHIAHALMVDMRLGAIIPARGEQGFLLSDGAFADRYLAGQVALRAGQIVRLAHPPNLYSEDLW